MALYRNIAGIPADNGRMGSSLTNPGGALTLVRDPAEMAEYESSYAAEMQGRYDWLLSHSYNEVIEAGYYVTSDNGSIFKWTDQAAGNSVAYLPLDWIQEIENGNGTAGTLLLHMQEPALAKDTAGYGGGSSGTFSGQPPTESDPIIAVQVLPPVSTDSTGTVFYDPGTVSDIYPTTTTTTTTTSTPLPVDTATALKTNWLPLAVLAGVLVVAVGGDDLVRRHSRLVLLGGVGALFYLIAKK